jgi:hypothetical protein
MPLLPTGGYRDRYKAALVETLRRQRAEFHVVAQLPCGARRHALEDALYAWVARVDRRYLGRSWAAPGRRADRMAGVASFEEAGGGHHAHLVVRPPSGASRLDFLLNAPLLFQRNPERLLRGVSPRPVAPPGPDEGLAGGAHPGRPGEAPPVRRQGPGEGTGHRWKFLDELRP